MGRRDSDASAAIFRLDGRSAQISSEWPLGGRGVADGSSPISLCREDSAEALSRQHHSAAGSGSVCVVMKTTLFLWLEICTDLSFYG